MSKTVRSVRLSDEVWGKLQKMAEKEKRSVSNLIELALEGFLKKVK